MNINNEMSIMVIILLMWLVTFLPRWIGLNLSHIELSPFWHTFLRFVPISVFAAIIVPTVLGSPEWPRQIIACLIGGLLVWRTSNLSIGIIGGFIAYWLARSSGL